MWGWRHAINAFISRQTFRCWFSSESLSLSCRSSFTANCFFCPLASVAHASLTLPNSPLPIVWPKLYFPKRLLRCCRTLKALSALSRLIADVLCGTETSVGAGTLPPSCPGVEADASAVLGIRVLSLSWSLIFRRLRRPAVRIVCGGSRLA